MCPNTFLLYVAIFAAGIFAIYIYRRLFESIEINFITLSGLLQAPQKYSSFLRTYIEGYYKDRKVTLICPHFDEGKSRIFYIEPRRIPTPQKAFLFFYPRPTNNTQWKGRKIYYSPGGAIVRLRESYFAIYSREEYAQILEELTEAADKVESGQSHN